MFKPVVNALVLKPIANTQLFCSRLIDKRAGYKIPRSGSAKGSTLFKAAAVLCDESQPNAALFHRAFLKRMSVFSMASKSEKNMRFFTETVNYIFPKLANIFSHSTPNRLFFDEIVKSAINSCPVKSVYNETYLSLLKYRLTHGDALMANCEIERMLDDVPYSHSPGSVIQMAKSFKKAISHDYDLRRLFLKSADQLNNRLNYAQAAKTYVIIGEAIVNENKGKGTNSSNAVFFSAYYAYCSAALVEARKSPEKRNIELVMEMAINALACAKCGRVQKDSLRYFNDVMETLGTLRTDAKAKQARASILQLLEKYTLDDNTNLTVTS